MKIGGFSFLNRTSNPRSWSVAAWHSPHSLTWRWSLIFSLFKGDERRAHWRLLWVHRNNSGIMLWILLPWIGRIDFQTQQPLWYRTLYIRERDERDHARYLASIERHANRMRDEAAALRGEAPLH